MFAEAFFLALVHLRGSLDEDAPPLWWHKPTIFRPQATHELGLYAMHPRQSYWEMIDGGSVQPIMPPNYIGQFRAADDASAIRRVEQTVSEIAAGILDPDTDTFDFAVEAWKDRYGDHCYHIDGRRFGGKA